MDGREPAETTTYEYAVEPRPGSWWRRLWPWRRRVLVRAVTVRESLWTEQDRAELLALAEYRTELCPACGGLLSECTSHEADGPSFRAKAVLCRRREHLSMAQKARGGEHPEAWVWAMTTVPPKRRPRR